MERAEVGGLVGREGQNGQIDGALGDVSDVGVHLVSIRLRLPDKSREWGTER